MSSIDEHMPAQPGTTSTGKLEKLMPILVAAGLFAIATAFWALNGVGVFSEMIAGAWALCF